MHYLADLYARRQNTTGLHVDERARQGYVDGMEAGKSAHSVYLLQYHVVWVCKYRRRILNPGVCA